MATQRKFVAPRNMGENSVPRKDHMLLLLPPAKDKVPAFERFKNADRTKGADFKKIYDPNANKVF
jgi:hypothetical protein